MPSSPLGEGGFGGGGRGGGGGGKNQTASTDKVIS
jgi:hypothetical protein